MRAAEIRAAYPHPQKSILVYENKTGCWDGLYCVGGAYIKYAHIDLPPQTPESYYVFPGTHDLAVALQQGNPLLDFTEAYDHAVKIVEYNDTERFELAYEWLDKALIYGKEEPYA